MMRRRMRVRPALGLLSVLAVALMAGCATAAANPEAERAMKRFARDMAEEHDFEARRVRELLERSERQQGIIDAMERPAEAMPWYRYRRIFVREDRIEAGVAFWSEHAQLIQRVSERYGIPASILVAIVGVETRYGTYTGRHRVLDALRTLAFDYPPRSSFFRDELAEYLLLTREEELDPLAPVGSYAGAMGMPQFIASSYRAYAVDFNGNGRRDLWDELPDVLASVANYFARHGWEPGEEVAVRAQVSGDRWAELQEPGLKPQTSVGALVNAGVSLTRSLPASASARLTVLEGKEDKQYWVTLNNFYVITRYNHSALYAMAVYQLSLALQEQRGDSA